MPPPRLRICATCPTAGPGITRTGQPGAFAYFDPQGSEIKDGPTLDRIRALGIPPAYRDVWICPLANGHLQFTGKDARGPQAVSLPRRLARRP